MKKYWVLFLCLLVAGCAMGQPQAKSFDQMSPMERLTWAQGVYNSQFAEYQRMAGMEMVETDTGPKWVKSQAAVELTEAQKKGMRSKKKQLQEVYPLIESYKVYVDSGSMPPAEKEKILFEMIDKLTLPLMEE